MINNLLFLSKGIQLAFFFGVVIMLLMFMKINTLERAVKTLEKDSSYYLTTEEYMETFNTMFNEKENGRDILADQST